MPTYEYACRACKHELEMFQSMKDAPKRKCPKCGKNSLERKIGLGAAILFKGSGFYQTDYRTESYKKGADAEKPATDTKTDSKADSKSESGDKTDAKPAKTKTESKSESKPKTESKSDSKPKSKKDK